MDPVAALELLESSIRPLKSPAVLFSGGLDSSMIAFLADSPRLYTLCHSEESYDLINARKSAELLGLRTQPVFFSESDVKESAESLGHILSGVTSVDVAHYLLARGIGEREALSGQGADELFLGYAKYSRMGAEEKIRRAEEDFERWMREGREKRIFSHLKKEIIFPYAALRDVATALPLEEREEKRALRSLALHLGLPEEIALQHKKAMQYGSGVARVMKRLSASSSSRSSRS